MIACLLFSNSVQLIIMLPKKHFMYCKQITLQISTTLSNGKDLNSMSKQWLTSTSNLVLYHHLTVDQILEFLNRVYQRTHHFKLVADEIVISSMNKDMRLLTDQLLFTSINYCNFQKIYNTKY